jgi:quercetin dioxygenase-like cupin family protein
MQEGSSVKPKGLAAATVANVKDLINYQDGAVVSREIIKNPGGNVTLFAFDEGEGLTEHSSPFDALVHVLEGVAGITIAGQSHLVHEGELILMPAGQPHALKALKRYKMMLTMIKS